MIDGLDVHWGYLSDADILSKSSMAKPLSRIDFLGDAGPLTGGNWQK